MEACSGWLRETEALVPSLTVRVLDARGRVVPDASIRGDGHVQRVGVPVELDPGEHAVVAVAATTESRTIVLRPGEQQRALDIVMSPEAPTPPAPAPSLMEAVQ